MSLQAQVVALAQSIGADIKALFARAMPAGGTTGQVLAKTSATDYAATWQTPSGGGGLTQGTAVLDFGAFPGSNTASVVVGGLAGISAGHKPKAFVNANATTADHTASDHKYFACFVGLACGDIVPATSMSIHAISLEKLQGQWTVNYEF